MPPLNIRPDDVWPPGPKAVHESYRQWDAWLCGDRDELARVYGGADAAVPVGFTDRESQFRGGLVGTLARFFWGQPQSPGQRSPKLHVPIASDIASTSANMLFAEPPAVTIDNDSLQERLDELLDDEVWAQLHHAAELSAGLGGAYLQVGWDDQVAPRPLVKVLGPECAHPIFRWGHLQEVTFAWVLPHDDHRVTTNTVYRHLEHHTVGQVEHALYVGDDDRLGMPVPLTDMPTTARLADVVDDLGAVPTGLDTLDVIYVPNARNRRWRKDPQTQHLGQPDIAGVEPLLDALDEAYTSWMRDVRLGKARIMVPNNYLTTAGRGKGATFDLDQELFTGIETPAGSAPTMQITPNQFAIRYQEHHDTCEALLERILAGAGYSAQTFGLTAEVAMTATEAAARERKTYYTRGGKIRTWSPVLSDLATLLMAVDAKVFGGRVLPEPARVEFPPLVRDNAVTLAQTAQQLRAAEAVSTETLVHMLHPEFDEDEVAEEVARIEDEKPAVPDPLAMFDEDAAEDEDPEADDEDTEDEDDEAAPVGTRPDPRERTAPEPKRRAPRNRRRPGPPPRPRT